jgi:hypothetical protein
MVQARTALSPIVVKTIVTHTITYSIMGILALVVFDYASLFTETGLKFLMRPISDPMTVAAPLFQPIRGVLFGVVFYLLREPLFGRKQGWLVMWTLLVVVGILGTFGPTPGSLEGVYFTVLPLWVHLRGLPEVLLQTLLLSGVLFYWVNHPQQKWLNWVMGIGFVLFLSLPILGLLVGG